MNNEAIANDKTKNQKALNIETRIDSLPVLDKIHEDAIRVLEEVGVRCLSPKVREYLENTGLAAYDETTGHLYILNALVEQALSTLPKRDRYWVGENSFGIGGTAPFVYDDMAGDLVQPTFEHLEKICRIGQEADVVDFMARGVLLPKQEVKVMDIIAANFHKPIYVAAITDEGIARAERIHKTRGNLTVQFSIINSPLNVIESMVPSFIECVKRGIPVYVSTMPMAGLSAPYSMSSLLTLVHAEALFGITLAQVINPGTTVVHAGLPSIASINKNYGLDLGLVSHNAANLLLDHVNKKLDIPSIHSACTTSAEKPCETAEREAARGYALMKKHGFHQMRHAFGFLKDLVSFSVAKLVRHIEICRETTPDSAPDFDFSVYDPEGFDAIARNGSSPNYMRDDHTLKNLQRYFVE